MLLEIFDPKAPPRPIGIDLGTTNSIVARMRDGSPTVIRDCDGEWLIPSAVHVDDRDHVIVGRHALTLASTMPHRTVVSVKRLMGRGADDEETRRLSTFDFVPAATEEDAKSVRFRVGQRVMTAVEASAEILKSLHQMAKDELGPVGGAVITVPAYFDDAQRQATKDAAKLAGLPVLRLLNEPTAAALAYGLEQRKNGLFAVFDLGGGTFDITILSLDDGVFEVKSTGGNTELGGDDMDRVLAERILEAGGDSERTARRVRAALDASRQIKHALTQNEIVEIEASDDLPAFRITREAFEALVRPIVEKTGATCKRAMRDAGITVKDLDGVILVGGSTRVPLVRRYVGELFGKEPLSDLNPEEVVALGAAIQAHQLAGEGDKEDILLLDVLPLSLGMATMGGVVEKILPRNTPIPASARQVFTTYADNQTGFDLAVVQGERELAADCRSLARFLLKGIPPMAAGLARLEVTFAVDADGLLQVHAKELTTGVEQTIQVKPSYGLTDEEVEAMLMSAIDHGEKDLLDRRLVEERVEAERVIHATEKALATDAELLLEGEREAIDAAIRAAHAAIQGGKPALIHARVEQLDEATKAWAGRRMDRAIATAIAGRRVGDVESTVSAAKGVDQHLREHGSGRNV